MLRKIWNTLLHGDSKTKAFLYTVILLVLAMFGFFVFALVNTSFLAGMAAAVCGIFVLATAKDVVLTVKRSEASGKTGPASKEKKTKSVKRRTGAEEEAYPEEDEAEESAEETDSGKSKKKKKSKKEQKREEQEAKEAAEREQEDEKEFGENALASMTVEKLKRLMIRYKVKQEHVPVVIDLCIPERVRQVAGFAWVEDGMLRILLIDRKPRMMERPLSRLQVMEVERGIAVKASGEYVELRESEVMKKAFTPYLPKYQKKEIGGRTLVVKNLYILDEDIKFTSTSVNELKKLFSFRIEIADRRLQDMDLSPYYKKVFVDSFLWRDGILSLQEFKAQVEQTLDSLAEPAVPYGEFETTLSAMISSGLIPPEYRNYANAKREEKERGTTPKKGKRKGRK